MTRERLPDRRMGFALDFEYGGRWAKFTVAFSIFPDWRCAEVFLNVAPSQGTLEKDIRDAAILASLALQHGASLPELIGSVTHEEDGSASSIIGTALILVRDEIGRLRGDDVDTVATGPLNGTGGAGASIAGATVRVPDVASGLVPADPKELQNDGDPIVAASDVWPFCATCQCRHAARASCPVPDAAARRHTQLMMPEAPAGYDVPVRPVDVVR